MGCEKHGYTNPTFCPACDLEMIEAREQAMRDLHRIARATHPLPTVPVDESRPIIHPGFGFGSDTGE